MNLLENFVNKFSLEQKSVAFNFNDSLLTNNDNSYRVNVVHTKSHNTTSPKYEFNFANHGVYMLDNIENNNSNSDNSGTSGGLVTTNSGGHRAVYSSSNINSDDTAAVVQQSGMSANCSSSQLNGSNNNNIHGSKKGMRNMFSFNQIEILENIFEQTHYPDSTMREKLSAHLGINSSRIQVWFQNRRAKFRKFDMKNKKCGGKFVNQKKNQELINFTSASFENETSIKQARNTNEIMESNLYTPAVGPPSVSQINTNAAYCSENLVLNSNSYTNYLKSQFAPMSPVSSHCATTDDMLTSNYFSNQNEHLANYGYHNFASSNVDFQKPFDRIQTLYPNTTYQLYAHYQGDDNF